MSKKSWGVGISEDGQLFGSTANGCPSVWLGIANRYYESVRGWSPGPLESIAAWNRYYPVTDKVRQVDWHGGFTAAAGHALLYALGLGVPVAGWAYSNAAGFPVAWLGVVPLPDLLPADKSLAALVKAWHAVLAWSLAVLAAGHVGAALWHQWVQRDRLLERMSPWPRTPRP